MNEITIDMSPFESPKSTHKLLSSKCIGSSPTAKDLEGESTVDTYSGSQFELRLRILPNIVPHLVYHDEIIKHLKKQEAKHLIPSAGKVLDSHKITAELRAKMVDWIIEVVYKTECTLQTLFRSVSIIDRFLYLTANSYKGSDMHIIGVAAMLLSSKFEEVSGMDVSFMFEQVVHKKMPLKEIADFEVNVLKDIGFCVSVPTELDFLEAFAENLGKDYITEETKFLATINLFDLNIATIKASTRAVASLSSTLNDNSPEHLGEVMSKLSRLSGISVKEINEVAMKIEKHREELKKMYPKLKNVFNCTGFK